MLKFSILVFISCLFLAYANEIQSNNNENYQIDPKLGESIILEMIEKIRKTLPDSIEYDIPETDLSSLGLDGKLSATGAKISGFKNFKVENLKLSLIFRLTTVLKLPQLKIEIENYKFTGSMNSIPFFGNGKVDFTIKDIEIDTGIQFGAEKVTYVAYILTITNILKLDPSINGDVKFEITGWLNDEIRSKLISNGISNGLASIVNSYSIQIRETVKPILLELVKDLRIPVDLPIG